MPPVLLTVLLLLPALEPATLSSVVLGPDERPIAGATVRPFLRADPFAQTPSRWIGEAVMTDTEGRFDVIVPRTVDGVGRANWELALAASSDGSATACIHLGEIFIDTGKRRLYHPDTGELLPFQFVLYPSVTRSVRVVGSDGQPLSGARLVDAYAYDEFDCPTCWISDPVPGRQPPVSDADGLLTIEGLPTRSTIGALWVEHPEAAGSVVCTLGLEESIGDQPVGDEPMYTLTAITDTVSVQVKLPSEVARCQIRAQGQIPGSVETSEFTHDVVAAFAAGINQNRLVDLRLPRCKINAPEGIKLPINAVDHRGNTLFAIVEAAEADRSLPAGRVQVVAGRTYHVRVWEEEVIRGEFVSNEDDLPFDGRLYAMVPRPVERGQPPLDDLVVLNSQGVPFHGGLQIHLFAPVGDVTVVMVSSRPSLASPMRQSLVVPPIGLDLPPWPIQAMPDAIRGQLLRADGQPAGPGVIRWPEDRDPPDYVVNPLGPSENLPVRTAAIDAEGWFEFRLHDKFRVYDRDEFDEYDRLLPEATGPVVVPLQAIIDGETFNVPLPLEDPKRFGNFQFTLPGD